MKIFSKIIQFQWDNGNTDKNFKKHKITDTECEELFFDDKKLILKDVLHSDKELRFILLGQTKIKKLLFVVFTIRNNKIRIISCRNVNKNERKIYEKRT
ncbi:MAG: BrnT family toxin [bacterium]